MLAVARDHLVATPMLALAWLAATRAELAAPEQPGGTPHSWLTTSANEIRRLFTAFADRRQTSSTSAAGHDGATTTKNTPSAAITSDNATKITK